MDNADTRIESAEKDIQKLEQAIESRSLAMEILSELKQTTKRLWGVIVALLILLALTIGAFLLYLNQYDYTSINEYSATGVNAIIDNTGNVVAQDIPDDKLIQIMEILNNGNGEVKDNQITN